MRKIYVWKKPITLIFICFAVAMGGGITSAMAKCASKSKGAATHDPCPDATDIKLPMPGGLYMSFRKIIVPGKHFWGDHRRIVKLGDAQGGIFQAPRKIMVGGSFTDAKKGDWYYLIGKYEVSKAQAAVVFGNGDLKKGVTELVARSGNPKDKALLKLSGKKLNRALAYPVAWLRWFDYQEFLSRYNRWCFDDKACAKAMPRLSGTNDKNAASGFLRLPTESEWEYAARGGSASTAFDDELPFPRSSWKKYAFVQPNAKSKPRRIGTLKPSYGLYDMFGNVQEITWGPFQAELGQGKAGALAVRGGSFLNKKSDIRSSFRTEIGLYQTNAAGIRDVRSPTSGIRLAIGSPVIPTKQFRLQIEKEFNSYLSELRSKTPAGQSMINTGVQASSTIQNAQATIKQISQSIGQADGELGRKLQEVQTALNSASRQLEMRNQQVCDTYVREGMLFTFLYGRADWDFTKVNLLAKIKGMKKVKNARDQAIIQKLQKTAAHESEKKAIYFKDYLKKLHELASCGERLATTSLENFDKDISDGKVSRLERETFVLLKRHFKGIEANKLETEAWAGEFLQMFRDKKLLGDL
jgi:hypothetical protein